MPDSLQRPAGRGRPAKDPPHAAGFAGAGRRVPPPGETASGGVYSWERVTDQYELLLHGVSGVPLPGRLRPTAGQTSDLAASARP